MHADVDVLGSEGRKAVDACVKVKIIGNPVDTDARCSWESAVKRLLSCFAEEPNKNEGGFSRWFVIDELLLPRKYDDEGNEKTYDILDIREARENSDKKLFVENLIDKRRKDIEKEYQEAYADPNARLKYSWLVAQRRVRDCFAGTFAGDCSVYFPYRKFEFQRDDKCYNIIDIYKAVLMCKDSRDKTTDSLRKVPTGPGSEELKESIEKNNFDLDKEYQEARRRINCYSKEEAEKRARGCLGDKCLLGDKITFDNYETGDQTFYIFDIYQEVSWIPSQDRRDDIFKSVRDEYKSAVTKLGKYSRNEAERRVRYCLPGTFGIDTDIFPFKKVSGIPETEQTYDIVDIKRAVDHFCERKLIDQFVDEVDEQSKKRNQKVIQEREKIDQEYAEATKRIEIEHGSGFIINDHYVITNKHVINDVKDLDIYISNASIGELSCKTAYTDAGKDLALLYCQELSLEQYKVTPLHLSNEPLLPGMKVFSFGYPMSHTGKTALFVNGHVSGSKETYSDISPSPAVLNLSLNSGNSGGPILCWVANQLKVVGVATQKHFKEILKLEEIDKIEKIRESLQTSSISGISDGAIRKAADSRNLLLRCGGAASDPRQIPMFLLTLKLYDALQTHSQFNLSNAIPGHCVIQFIDEFAKKPEGGCKDELIEVVKWSADPDILPSGHHSAAECCVQ